MPKHSRHFLQLAKRGAELEFRDLAMGMKLLLDAFPHLQDAFDDDELPSRLILALGARQRSRPTSAAARKAAGRRTKKY